MADITKERLFLLACLVISALVYWSADQIPASLMDKFGAGLVPKILAVALAILSTLQFISGYLFRKKKAGTTQGVPPAGSDGSLGFYVRIAVVMLVFAAFIFVLDLEIVPFWVSGFVFVFIETFILAAKNLRGVIEATATAAISVGVIVVVLTQVFTVILP